MIKISTIELQPKQAVHALALVISVLFVCYMYFIFSAVVQVVIREETDQLTQNLRSDISVLESKYIAAQHRVSEHISMLEGYDKVSDKTFIDRHSPSLVLGTIQ